jgi:hypothetical protein
MGGLVVTIQVWELAPGRMVHWYMAQCLLLDCVHHSEEPTYYLLVCIIGDQTCSSQNHVCVH